MTIHVDLPAPYVAVVTLDRPPVNAMGREIRERFIATFDELQEREDVRAIVLTATGKVFCAGADIKEKQALGARHGDRQAANRLTRESFFALTDSTKPVIAAVNGAALGAGFVMAACCDAIIAADTAFFAMPEIDVGQGGGASLLRDVLPRALMRRMLLTGERVPAAELHRVGAVLEVVPGAELLPRAVALASVIAEKSPTAVAKIRGTFSAVDAMTARDGFLVEQRYTTELNKSADAEEARRAFFEKRRPVFGNSE
ncbi:enoyl-CoA hydratase/isomerase family protein [Phytohabitans flavus]|uniref:Enoyl-CoA hydratase n=1 Tax=Phytohabitans flavus TaxID=1076124 RepID=A0A6F8XVX2_9ACTN|nr:enoyl-CoA hydratase/isomerase family protein [Phytohabitans flavus]BCB77888.1 enoyl-CoA hydratase [Phytohabitans flavus]